MRIIYPPLTGRPDLTTVLTKLHIFRLTQFQKIIFLDADVLPIRPLSHLFNVPHEFSAAPDVGWPDIFNSGVLVVSPGNDKFNELYELLKTKPSWDGGDQGLLNEWRGENWNRLSFTYNTTPTAAYTYVSVILLLFPIQSNPARRYAPAYERYGSKISALHFIGPNKPWNALPSRPPFAGRQTEASDASHQRAYDYPSLVDRWFDVYDRHYRVDTPETRTHFEVKSYPSAWDRPAHSQPVHSTKSYDLVELKHLAIAGLNSSSPATHLNEGVYQSLPLEGRIDLMRPKKPDVESQIQQAPFSPIQIPLEDWDYFPSESFSYDEALSTPVARRFQLDELGRWHTLPTPAPHEVPNGPRIGTAPLPFTPTPIPTFGGTASDFYASESESESLLLARPPSRPSSAGGYYHHHSHGHRGDSQSLNNHSRITDDKVGDETQHQGRLLQYQVDKSPSPGPFEQPESQDKPFLKSVPQRTISPPLLSWNPAVEPPPSDAPSSAFPSDTYFTNVWDQTPSKQDDRPSGTSPDLSRLFEPPPTPAIPVTLLQQGHYHNVTGGNHDTTPSPDRSKVRKVIFPWEEKLRPLPGRVFPDSDAPSPSLFLSPGSPSQTSTTNPSTPEMRGPTGPSRISPLSPLRGLPTSLSFVNAWDNSIQKYATRPVKPLQPPTPLAPAFDEESYRKGRRKSRDERSEVSSRDGDDEDNADEEDEGEPAPASATKWDEDDDSEREKVRRRSRSGSVVGTGWKPSVIAAPAMTKKPKRYKGQGVQTTIIETREQGIQVDPPLKPDRNPKKSPIMAKRFWHPATTAASTSVNDNPSSAGPLSLQPTFKKRAYSVSSPPQSPMKPMREFLSPPPLRTEMGRFNTSSPPLLKSSMRTSSSTLTGVATPMPPPPEPVRSRASSLRSSTSSIARQTSNDSSLGSPASSYGPLSPLDAHVLLPSARKGGRVWDPARGVDIFKKGSEEVLARFLRMGTFDDEAR